MAIGNRGVMVVVAALIVTVGLMAVVIGVGSDNGEIRIAYSNKVDYEPLILADHMDLYQEAGVDTSSLIVTGGIQAAEALATGSVEVAAMGDAPAILLISQNPGMRIIARYGGGEGMHRIVAWNDIEEAGDLEGKKIGVQHGSSTHGALLAWADANGLDVSGITLVPLSPTDMPEAMATRQIDAMTGSEPWPTNVETTCGEQVHEIGNSSGLGNTFPLVLVTTEKVIEERTQDLSEMLDAIEQAIDIIEEDREAAAMICCQYTGISQENQLRCMNSLFYQLGFDQSDGESLATTAAFLAIYGKIDQTPDIESCLDLSLLSTSSGGGLVTCIKE